MVEPSTLKTQAIAYKHLLALRFPNNFENFCTDRIANLLSLEFDPCATLDLGDSFKTLKKMRKHEAFQVIKTWINSWATSRRFDHDSITLPCIFGCGNGCEDDLAHYIKCVILWSLVESKISFSLPSQSLERVGVIRPTKQDLHLLAAIFQAYHGTKKWLRDLEIDLHTFLTCEPNLVSIRRRFLDSFSISLRGMPGEETAITNNSANDLVFLYDGESLPGDLSDLNFTNPESQTTYRPTNCVPLNHLLPAAIDCDRPGDSLMCMHGHAGML